MSLYLSPPTGTVPLHKLQDYATKRLQFLIRLIACKDVDDVLEDAHFVEQSECLITDSAKDLISHFILRLTLGGDHESMSFFCNSELALFRVRLEKMVEEEWSVFFKTTDKFLCKLKENINSIQNRCLCDLICLFEKLRVQFESWSQLSTAICTQEDMCALIHIPFQQALKLVSGRQVDVRKGIAMVPVKLLKEVFSEQFEKFMQAAATHAVYERDLALRDERIKQLAAALKHVLKSESRPHHYHSGQFPPLQLSDLWSHSFLFPPCMANVVKMLQMQHRLKHQDRYSLTALFVKQSSAPHQPSRYSISLELDSTHNGMLSWIQLTLFLKELGFSVHDALLLWKREYSVQSKSSNAGGCHHGWHGNERRYIYNIRHLYGLEGSRIDYRAHSCSTIQGRALSCGDAGGCPFVSSDITSLRSMHVDQKIDKCSMDYIIELCKRKQYGCACQRFMIYNIQQTNKKLNVVKLDGKSIKTEINISHDRSVIKCSTGARIIHLPCTNSSDSDVRNCLKPVTVCNDARICQETVTTGNIDVQACHKLVTPCDSNVKNCCKPVLDEISRKGHTQKCLSVSDHYENIWVNRQTNTFAVRSELVSYDSKLCMKDSVRGNQDEKNKATYVRYGENSVSADIYKCNINGINVASEKDLINNRFSGTEHRCNSLGSDKLECLTVGQQEACTRGTKCLRLESDFTASSSEWQHGISEQGSISHNEEPALHRLNSGMFNWKCKSYGSSRKRSYCKMSTSDTLISLTAGHPTACAIKNIDFNSKLTKYSRQKSFTYNHRISRTGLLQKKLSLIWDSCHSSSKFEKCAFFNTKKLVVCTGKNHRKSLTSNIFSDCKVEPSPHENSAADLFHFCGRSPSSKDMKISHVNFCEKDFNTEYSVIQDGSLEFGHTIRAEDISHEWDFSTLNNSKLESELCCECNRQLCKHLVGDGCVGTHNVSSNDAQFENFVSFKNPKDFYWFSRSIFTTSD